MVGPERIDGNQHDITMREGPWLVHNVEPDADGC
jgi:hypothetical protein